MIDFERLPFFETAMAQQLRNSCLLQTIPNMTVISGVTENNIASKIREAANRDPFVIVDLEGTAAKIVVLALQEADFVVVPMQGSLLDAEQCSGQAIPDTSISSFCAFCRSY
ncbi:division plane positioning ATPase MipZ [Pseudomonas baltica]|uniref:division plane positioning ATPase MipZ n=1 Tax=Pseudomonas baltica TaxID=2762576 RepID=UPI00289EC701|nr:division plane positioning ATPase MipZ [Pseudomonas baltica]